MTAHSIAPIVICLLLTVCPALAKADRLLLVDEQTPRAVGAHVGDGALIHGAGVPVQTNTELNGWHA